MLGLAGRISFFPLSACLSVEDRKRLWREDDLAALEWDFGCVRCVRQGRIEDRAD